jgi:hypothetical protein
MRRYRVPDPLKWRKGGLDPGIRRKADPQEKHGPAKLLYSRDWPKTEGSLQCAYCHRWFREAVKGNHCPMCFATIPETKPH